MRRIGLGILVLGWVMWVSLAPLHAAPYAAMVMDARNGEVIHARNHDTKLHPASLTKMMTLYVAFEAVKHGEVGLDTKFRVSRRATKTECVCLGLREGQTISLRYLIRAAALRSANDAAVVIAEGISGSVEAFAERMTRTARAMGMSNSTFKNPHGLTQAGHVSTARDMTILGRQLFFDYPQYFNIFSRRSDFAGVANVPNTNRRFLDAYQGANGIKTGYTRAAGFNLTASAQRGSKHIITTMFGGSSTAARNAKVAELMDMGFSRAKSRVAVRPPATPAYQGRGALVAAKPQNGDDDPNAGAKTIRLVTAVRTSPRPLARPVPPVPDDVLVAVVEGVDLSVSQTVEELSLTALAPAELDVSPPPRPEAVAETVDLSIAEAAGFGLVDPADLDALEEADAAALDLAEAQGSLAVPMDITSLDDPSEDMAAAAPETVEPAPLAETSEPVSTEIASVVAEAAALGQDIPQEPMELAQNEGPPAEILWTGAPESFLPSAAPSTFEANVDLDVTVAPPIIEDSGIILTRSDATDEEVHTAIVAETFHAETPQIISRVSTSDDARLWGISLGAFNSRHDAERSLITVKMAEAQALSSGISRIRQTSGRFEASFAGLTEGEADRACARLSARGMDCSVARP
ncbi:MAG: serine hydrolase [Rhodobacteraceae bacterium]|nr:serine hydrolase [Paracoccaceae bacterium]